MALSLGQSDNPLLRYSENMLGQSQQLMNAAIQQDMEAKALAEKKQMDDQTRKLAAELDFYSNAFVNVKDPKMKSLFLNEFGNRLGVDFSRATGRYDELTQQMKDIRTLVNDPNTPEDVQHKLIEQLVYDYGDYINPTEMKGLEKKLAPMQKAIPSAVLTKYGLPAGTTFEQAKALGVNLSDASGKKIERVDDLGDRLKTTFSDGSIAYERKGATPGAGIQERRLNLAEDKEARKADAEAKKEAARMDTALGKADLITGKIDKALDQSGFFTTGFVGGRLSNIKGTSAYDLDRTIDTVKANIGFQELADMRAASPTGGALGQIAVRELEFLQAALGSLEPGQSKKQLVENLQAIKTHYQNWKNAVQNSKGMPSPTPSGGKVRRYNPATGRIE